MCSVFYVLFNFFWLDPDPEQCAQLYGNAHVIKMILEYAQIGSVVWWKTDKEKASELNAQGLIYRPTHEQNPVVVWASESIAHYLAIVNLGIALLAERAKRAKLSKTWKASHKSAPILMWLRDNPPPIENAAWLRDPPACVPETIRGDPNLSKLSVVEQYRICYATYKIDVARLTWEPLAKRPAFLDEARKRGLECDAVREDLENYKKRR
jgi:hypothetical protein